MIDDISCPTCDTDEHLTGAPDGELIRLTCAACGASWTRDPSPRCGRCGSDEVVPVPKAAWDKARGTQLSISYITIVYLCPDCDAALLRRQRQTNSPLPPDVNPAASEG
jgi:hypothetical protein